MKTFIKTLSTFILLSSCSNVKENNENIKISNELNDFFNMSPFNVSFNTKQSEDSLFVTLTNLDNDTSYRDYRQEHFLYNLCFYEFYNLFNKYEYVSFSLPYKNWDYTSELWYTNQDIDDSHKLFTTNKKITNLAYYVKNNVSPYQSVGIQKSLDSLRIGFSDVYFKDDFYELLYQYSFECNKEIKESKYKKYMFIMTLLCKRGGEPFKEEYESLKYILNECDIDTNVLNKKEI
jgi:hypothetical protein